MVQQMGSARRAQNDAVNARSQISADAGVQPHAQFTAPGNWETDPGYGGGCRSYYRQSHVRLQANAKRNIEVMGMGTTLKRHLNQKKFEVKLGNVFMSVVLYQLLVVGRVCWWFGSPTIALMAEDSDQMAPAKEDAIHRALLAGLLGNVWARGEGVEYSGVRGKKFYLFPGSSLFRQKPGWTMAAELVETTKLYARTVASVHPLWIERMGAHLLTRTYTDPHWRPEIGRVLAFEKVMLQGLTLVPKRKVHYGPLEPRLSREIFIHHALVLGEYDTRAPYFEFNRRLIAEVQSLEAKSRRRDVLVEPKARFAFYDARIPERIYTADEFERWRHGAEKRNPKLLFMSRKDLMLHPALGVTEELFPDSMTVNEIRVPLEYRFELGDRADGVTATIPLAALNQVALEPFQWMVPGFRAEIFTAMIRTLPKALRVKFVPVPDFANAAARELKPGDGALLDALAHYLGKQSGERIRAEDFQPGVLAEYLKINFRVVDAGGKEIAMGRDLTEIRRRLGMAARASFAADPPPEWHRDDLTRWDFGGLPERIELRHRGMTLIGYPALVDAGASVSLRLMDTAAAAGEGNRTGMRRLFMLQVRQELSYLERELGDLDRLCLYYATLGRCDDLHEDMITAIADRAFYGDTSATPRSRAEFAAQAELGWRRLNGAAHEIRGIVGQVLEIFHDLELKLGGEFPPMWSDSIRDMRDQLSHLVYRGFVVQTPFEWLRYLPRYLKGIALRLERLANAGLTRDIQAMEQARPQWDRYKREAAAMRVAGGNGAEIEEIRWMIEELRVSLFAQELKAVGPVSVQRIGRMWEEEGTLGRKARRHEGT
jgi:ATP-dependent RNA helicase HrpA